MSCILFGEDYFDCLYTSLLYHQSKQGNYFYYLFRLEPIDLHLLILSWEELNCKAFNARYDEKITVTPNRQIVYRDNVWTEPFTVYRELCSTLYNCDEEDLDTTEAFKSLSDLKNEWACYFYTLDHEED